jgi:hypothetical protein
MARHRDELTAGIEKLDNLLRGSKADHCLRAAGIWEDYAR